MMTFQLLLADDKMNPWLRQMQKHLFTCLFVGMALSGCVAKVSQEGFPPAAEMKEKLGDAATRQDVLQKLGTPSLRNDYGDETWYYISTEKEARGFLAPTITRQDVLKLTFSADGTLTGSEVLDKTAGKDVAIYDKITPTEGHKLGFAEQVLGNVGRFNSPGSAKGPRQPHSGRIPGRI